MLTFISQDLAWALNQEREAEARGASARAAPRRRRRPLWVRGTLARGLVSLAVWLDGSAKDIAAPVSEGQCSRAA